MAPPKPETQQRRVAAARTCVRLLAAPSVQEVERHQKELSELKGLFNRAHRQDQWDWFTVWDQLGRPGRPRCRKIAAGLGRLRTAGTKKPDEARVRIESDSLTILGTVGLLETFSGDAPPTDVGGLVYILSTREQPDVLKIGHTERDIRKRVAEINRATGIVTPYGVRAIWRVNNAHGVERELHRRLAKYRIRVDREFFRLDYQIAFEIVRDFVHSVRKDPNWVQE